MTVSIFSYQGEVTAGFMADTGLVPDPQPLVAAFDAELKRSAAELAQLDRGTVTRSWLAPQPRRRAGRRRHRGVASLAERLDGYVERAQAAATSFRQLNQEAGRQDRLGDGRRRPAERG